MSGLPGDKGARKPSGLLCSSRTLEHRYHDEMGKPYEKRGWRRLAKRREERAWRKSMDEDLFDKDDLRMDDDGEWDDNETYGDEPFFTRGEFMNRLADYLFRQYDSGTKHVTGVVPHGMELEVHGIGDPECADEPELHLRYTLERSQGGRSSTTIQIYSFDDILDMVCDD